LLLKEARDKAADSDEVQKCDSEIEVGIFNVFLNLA